MLSVGELFETRKKLLLIIVQLYRFRTMHIKESKFSTNFKVVTLAVA